MPADVNPRSSLILASMTVSFSSKCLDISKKMAASDQPTHQASNSTHAVLLNIYQPNLTRHVPLFHHNYNYSSFRSKLVNTVKNHNHHQIHPVQHHNPPDFLTSFSVVSAGTSVSMTVVHALLLLGA